MVRKNLTLIFNHFEEEHLGKDVFLVPYYLGKIHNLDVKIVCPETQTNKKLPNKVRGVNIHKIKLNPDLNKFSFYTRPEIRSYLRQNAKKIDVLMTFHCTLYTFIMIFIYKLLNGKGISYIKADGGNILDVLKFSSIKYKIFIYLANHTDIISFERKEDYDAVIKNIKLKSKIKFIPNGFDEELLVLYNFKVNKFSEKQNIIINVGRLGTYQKNTELILSAVKDLEFNDWTMYMIGPIENKEQDFLKVIDAFYNAYPQLKQKIIFTGPIYDKQKLWEYYNNAKVFVLSSKYEGFAIVYTEAHRFSNYILTTNVGGAKEILCDGFGDTFSDDLELNKKLNKITKGEINLNEMRNSLPQSDMSWNIILKGLELFN